MTNDYQREPWERIEEQIAEGDVVALKSLLEMLKASDAARALSRLDGEHRTRLLELLEPKDAARLLEEIPDVQAGDLLEELEPKDAAAIVDELPSDDQVDVLEELEAEDAEAIIEHMDPGGGCGRPQAPRPRRRHRRRDHGHRIPGRPGQRSAPAGTRRPAAELGGIRPLQRPVRVRRGRQWKARGRLAYARHLVGGERQHRGRHDAPRPDQRAHGHPHRGAGGSARQEPTGGPAGSRRSGSPRRRGSPGRRRRGDRRARRARLHEVHGHRRRRGAAQHAAPGTLVASGSRGSASTSCSTSSPRASSPSTRTRSRRRSRSRCSCRSSRT